MSEKKAPAINGYLGIILCIIAIIGSLVLGFKAIVAEEVSTMLSLGLAALIFFVIAMLFLSSITVVAPNQARVITFFGKYLGTIHTNGLFMTVPFTLKQPISLKVRNFNSVKLKVNDVDGNPIEIAAVIVFKVIDTAKACFDVEYYENFVEIQSETAIRHIATKYSYDSFTDSDITLRGNAEEVSAELLEELQQRLNLAGVEVIETRLTHLAYSTEIASAMLQRQQAKAILSARKIIVEGAVGMTQLAVEQLEHDGVLKLDDSKRIQLVNNLLVSIITDKGTQPVINTGELNQ
ncbi:SPFH domain-containing protein [Isobaculum melis]|uniref:SPFH domain / Band 7 family protein n=1 Tax=Isobaculum melis TaxID=142588 RepID=A0A1H9TZ11_9LACT|nr:SPFH domain-containing protein [Isobaculum melis]SES02204.1 SPFH domain / Band 7 family protein [Isobaculum melis]